MSLVTQSNYTASNEDFVYADADSDQFDREHVAKVAKALANHDHASGRGAAVARLGSGVVTTAMLAADAVDNTILKDDAVTDANRAVTTNHIRDSAVTTAKIADLNVTAGKLAAGAATGAALGADVVTPTGSQTLTNKALTAPSISSPIITGLPTVAQGANVASAATITLGNDGMVFGITGTTQITTINAKSATTIVILKFANALCQVVDRNTSGAGNVYLTDKHYFSEVNSTLTLMCDGTNWYEIARSAPTLLNSRIVLVNFQSIPNNAITVIEWEAVAAEYPDPTGAVWVGADPTWINLVRPGLYLITINVTYDVNTSGSRKAQLSPFSGTGFDINEVRAATASREVTLHGAGFLRSDGTMKFQIKTLQDSGGALDISKEEYETHVHIHWIAR